jgi:hypothetical protein
MGVYTGIALDNVQINSGRVGATPVGGAMGAIKTASFTLGPAERYVVANGASANVAVTLPAASASTGREVTIKNLSATYTVISASSNVKPRNSDSAGTAILAATAGAWATLVSNGSHWVVMAAG